MRMHTPWFVSPSVGLQMMGCPRTPQTKSKCSPLNRSRMTAVHGTCTKVVVNQISGVINPCLVHLGKGSIRIRLWYFTSALNLFDAVRVGYSDMSKALAGYLS